MLYLVGDAPRCGKTTVSQHLAEALCCSRVPADYLGTAFTNYIPEAEWSQRYPSWGVKTVDERFARFSADEIIENYRIKADTVWPGIRDFCIYAMYQRHAMIVEGYQIEPRFAHELIATYPQFSIRAVFLLREQVSCLTEDLRKATPPDDWVVQNTTQSETFVRIARMVSRYSAFFREEAVKYQCVTFSMDDNFLERVSAVVDYLRAA